MPTNPNASMPNSPPAGSIDQRIALACAEQPMTAYELARYLGISQASITRAVIGLSEAGVVRQRQGSRRFEASPGWESLIAQRSEARATLFYSYSHRDRRLRDELGSHLSPLRREGLVEEWSDQQIAPGGESDREIARHLEKADIVVLLVSRDFIVSDYCYEREMRCALERHAKERAYVVPIIVRPCDWESSPFAKLQALPPGAKPVVEWKQRDRAWTEVAKGLRQLVDRMRDRPA